MDLDRRIVRYLEDRRAEGLGIRDAWPLAGDASNRSYYRVVLDEGSLVLSLMPSPFDPGSFSFLDVARMFAEIPVRIPEIHHVSGEEGIILLEDLGNDLLQDVANEAGSGKKRELYLEAISILARLQQRGAELRNRGYVPYRLAFDEDKLHSELDFFAQHFMTGFRAASLRPEEREALDKAFQRIAGELARLPRVVCHRDYHARNLMVVEAELAVIDFQDARMGPASYDLVSLLRDSYVEHDPDFEAEMREAFRRVSGGTDVESQFDLMSLQRNLKALGTFGFQISVRKNDIYRQYVDRTLGLVRENLVRNNQWDGLRAVLAGYLPEME
jgi:aminoglycoside/choline kinase family phosphotransferase